MTNEKIIADERYHTCGRCKWEDMPFICHACKWDDTVRNDLWEIKSDMEEHRMTNKEAQHHIRALLATCDFDYKERQALVMSFRALNVVQGIEDTYMRELLKTPVERGESLSETNKSSYGGVSWGGTYEPQQPSEDCISREKVFEQISCWVNSGEYRYTNATYYLTRRIQGISSVTPRQKVGKWIEYEDSLDGLNFIDITITFGCSNCHEIQHSKTKFCPNCGAKMAESEGKE